MPIFLVNFLFAVSPNNLVFGPDEPTQLPAPFLDGIAVFAYPPINKLADE